MDCSGLVAIRIGGYDCYKLKNKNRVFTDQMERFGRRDLLPLNVDSNGTRLSGDKFD